MRVETEGKYDVDASRGSEQKSDIHVAANPRPSQCKAEMTNKNWGRFRAKENVLRGARPPFRS